MVPYLASDNPDGPYGLHFLCAVDARSAELLRAALFAGKALEEASAEPAGGESPTGGARRRRPGSPSLIT